VRQVPRRLLPAVLALPAARARAEVAAPALAAAGWRGIAVPNRDAARFTLGAEGVIAVAAQDAVGFLLRPIAPGEVPPGRALLRWDWRVLAAPPPSDALRIGADDRPAGLHLLFAGAGRGGGLGAVLRRGLRRGMMGEAFGGRVLSYVWGGRAAAGSVLPNPHLEPDGVLLVRRGAEAPLGSWFEERVDFAADYRAAFGAAAPPPTHLALSADTDDQGGRALAEWRAPGFVRG